MTGALKPIVIVGAGGYAKEVAWLIDDINAKAPEWNLLGFVDPVDSGRAGHDGRPILGNYAGVSARYGQPFFACGIGTPEVRKKEAERAEGEGWQAVSLVHPSAFRAASAAIGEGATVGPACVLAPDVSVGRHVLLNVHASIGHDAVVGDFSVISPGARILGHVILGELVSVGANATVYPKRRMGSRATLGANSFLHADLAADQSALGVVAKPFLPKPLH